MAKRSSQVAITRFIKKIDRLEAFVSDEAYDALAEIGEEATDFMREIIKDQQSATYFSADAQVSGINKGPGRVGRTGAMLDSVRWWETSTGIGDTGSRLSISFGYYNPPPSKKYPSISYAEMQEEGFYNKWVWRRPLLFNEPFYDRDNKSGNWHVTEGIFALRDATYLARNIIRPKVATAASKAIAERMRGV